MDPRLEEFIRLFNSKEFFDAHEVLEGLWLETEGEGKEFYKGLIQCAVAFVHLDRANFRGATKLYKTACGYLNRYAPSYGGVNLQDLLTGFEGFFAQHVREDQPLDLDELDTPIIVSGELS